MFTKKTIQNIDLQHKTVLLRADFNVPIKKGVITDDYRIKQALPTIRFLLEKDVRLIICSHLGRPKNPTDIDCSLWPVAKRLNELLGGKLVSFAKDCIGPEADEALADLQFGHVLLLENVRFHPEEEANDPAFAKKLASYADIFVEDGFGVVHRAHATTEGITHYLPSVAGLLLAKEVDTITNVMEAPKRPLMAVIGGAKISDKIEVLKKFIDIADVVAVGGAMANTFLAAQDITVGRSLVEPEDYATAKEILALAAKKTKAGGFLFFLPQDGVVASKIDKTAPTRIVDWSAHVIADIENYPLRPPVEASEIQADEMILDIGPYSASFIAGLLQQCATVVWNGTMGVTETSSLQGPIGPTAHGTQIIIDAILGRYGHRPYSLVGGGDTVGYVESRHLVELFDHVSTGGGASLELMAGKTLPGVAALEDQ
jgi:phosphoglycerate kinase